MRENEDLFSNLITSIASLDRGDYAFLWNGASWEYFFLWRSYNDLYEIRRVEQIDSQDLKDKAWDDFDALEAWKDDVRDWYTESSYCDWKEDVDIWDYKSEWDYYWAPEQECEILYKLGLWDDEENDYNDDDEYLYEEYWGEFSKENVERLLNYLRSNKYKNQKLLDDMCNHFWLNEITFLDCEDIR